MSLSPLFPGQICSHTIPTIRHCTIFAICVSTLFVLNLYLLVPSRIRKLPRNDTIHIQWRSFSTLITVLVSIILYPLLFCQAHVDEFSSHGASLWEILGWSNWTLTPLLHAMVLYLGPIVASALRLHITALNHTLHCEKWKALSIYFHEVRNGIVSKFYGRNYMNEITTQRMVVIRDFVIAPLAEEIIFRSCIVPPFLSASSLKISISICKISWITPTFFGMAHIHHAFMKLRQPGSRVKMVVFGTIFQFIYTTLFGAFVTFSYIKTASLPGVVVVHSFCNWMGFPDFGDLLRLQGDGALHHDVRKMIIVRCYRIIVPSFLILGIVGFVLAFDPQWGFYPKENLLKYLVVGN